MFSRKSRRLAAVAAGNNLRFDHIQMYVPTMLPLKEYTEFEKSLNTFSTKVSWSECSIEDGRNAWKSIYPNAVNPNNYKSTNQDVVKQLIFGASARIRGHCVGDGTVNVLISMSENDNYGFHNIVTGPSTATGSDLHPYQRKHYDDYLRQNQNRGGIGIVAFRTGEKEHLEDIRNEYLKMHPKLVKTEEIISLDGNRIFEAYAYYLKDGTTPDTKTIVRYLDGSLLPLSRISPAFPSDAIFGYNDHWVSNVYDRPMFLQILEDILGFTQKVNFNAGVVGAGEAIIESTVTGNDPKVEITDAISLLRNEQQIYLPINNSLSPHGHVHLYLKELGQGIQHIATRVNDLPKFIAKANWYRQVTGEGLSFLKIPASYYGWIQPSKLSIPDAEAKKIINQLKAANLVDELNNVKLDIDDKQILAACGELDDTIVAEIKRARYNNLYPLLRDSLDEETYLTVVRNEVLVDIQGGDVLFQIFTTPILHRNTAEQAPFFEFIQRVCGETGGPVKAGCGGFGIRNFITLFLSIEVSKCMDEAARCLKKGDTVGHRLNLDMIEVYTAQQAEVNPILTSISDAMTAEADLLEQASRVSDNSKLLASAEEFRDIRLKGEKEMARIGEHYKKEMASLSRNLQR